MAERSYASQSERNAAIQHFVSWHSARGESSLGIYDRSKAVFGGKYNAAIRSAIAFDTSKSNAAANLNRSGAKGTFRDDTIPGNQLNPSLLRVDININLAGNNTTGRKGRNFQGLSIDIPFTLDKRDIYAAAKQAVIDQLAAKYEARQTDMKRWVNQFTITGLEGV